MAFKAVFNERGIHQPNAQWVFEQAIMSDHTPIVKIEFLYPGTYAVHDWILSGGDWQNPLDARGAVTTVVSDGSIDVDRTRGTRRTAELTLLNPTAEFTPTTANFDPDGKWVGKIYLNRLVKIWRGVEVEGNKLLVPCGVFMVDTAEVIVENNMSMVNLTLSDQWKRLTKSIMGFNKKYIKGTGYRAIIADLLAPVGLPTSGPLVPYIDQLVNRPVADRRINKPVQLERGMNRGEVLKELTWDWGLDAYFNVNGKFISTDRKKQVQKKNVWTFESRDHDEYGRHGGLVSLTRSFNDDNLYNHVIVIGTGAKKGGIRRKSIVDDRPNSKIRRAVIGDRVFLKETDKLSTQEEVNKAARRIWANRFQLSENIKAEVICHPGLDADDKVRIIERKFAKVDGYYRLTRITTPLVTSRQEIEATVILRGDDF